MSELERDNTGIMLSYKSNSKVGNEPAICRVDSVGHTGKVQRNVGRFTIGIESGYNTSASNHGYSGCRSGHSSKNGCTPSTARNKSGYRDGFYRQLSFNSRIVHLLLLLLLMLSAIAQVKGQYRSPSIVEHPSDLLVGRDEPATLNCHADGKPQPNIVWYKDGVALRVTPGSRHIVLDSGDLFFLQALQDDLHDDSGTYWCVASNRISSVRSNNATLEIAVLGMQFEKSPKDARVAEGEAAMLECRPPSGRPPPVVVWEKDGRQLDPAVNHRYRIGETGELVITSARVGDSGRYTCTARNAYATRTTNPATLTVLVKPHLVSSSGSVTSAVGATVELVCRVGGDPPPEVFWGRISPKGAQLPLERLVQEERGQVLRLRHVSPEDKGVYTCTAENPVGQVAANTTLTVHSRPVFMKQPKDARVGVDGTARFECHVSGSPTPTTYWTHEASGIIVSSGQTWSGGRISVGQDNSLTIVGVREQDTGYYACVGVGEAGSAIARAYLEVQGVSDMPPPIIAIGARNQTLPLGTEAELPCEAKGTPEPVVSWSFKGRPVDVAHSRRHTITPLGTLRIVGLRPSDGGLYSCTAASISGSSVWQASLVLHKATNPNIRFVKMFWESDLPEPPQNLMVLGVNATQVTLGWSRGRAGASPIRTHSVQYWSADLRGQWKDGTVITPPRHVPTPLATTVTNLLPNTRYVFTVRSHNKESVSRPASFTHVIRTLESGINGANSKEDTPLSLREIRIKLSSPTVRLMSVEALSSTSLKVTWRILINDPNLLEGVYVRYRPLDFSSGQPSGALSVETIHFPIRGERSTGLISSGEITDPNQRKYGSNKGIVLDQIRPSFGGGSLMSQVPTNHIVSNLRPSTGYEVFVVPFYRNIEGQPTSSIRRTTLTAPVLTTPTGLHFRVVNETTVRVGWDPLPLTMDVGGRLKGYNLQGLDVSAKHLLVHNSTTNSTFVFVQKLKHGIPYEFSVRGITNIGLGAPSETLHFIPTRENITKSVPSNSIPSSTTANNTYMIIAIVCAAILVFCFLLGAVICIYRKQNLSKCPHYFSKGDCSSAPWSAYSGCWEEATNTGGINTTRYTESTVPALNNSRYTDGTLTGLSNIRYTDTAGGGNITGINTTIYTDGAGQFYTANNDSKGGYEVRPAEDLMYEDPDGLRLVSFKTRHNQRCASPEPYATTPLITGIGEGGNYPRNVRGGGNNIVANRLPPNIPHIAALDGVHNYNTQSDKGSLSSGPVLQFPAPPPPPPLSVGEGGSSSTTASTNSNTNSNASRGPASRGGSSQHLFLQHLPYHSTAGSNSGASHHTSPLLHPRQSRNQTSSSNAITNNKISPNHNNFKNQNINPSYKNQGQHAASGDPFLNIHSGGHSGVCRAGLDNWLSSGVGIGGVENGFIGGEYPPISGRCHSPESSAMGDAEESDDKEGEESCWSEGSRGTNDKESSNGSASGSISSLNPDLNWTEAVRLMSENKWPNDFPKQVSEPSHSNSKAFNQFSHISENNSDIKDITKNEEDVEVRRKLLGNVPGLVLENSVSYDGTSDGGSSNYYCQLPVDAKNEPSNQNSKRVSDRPLVNSKSSPKVVFGSKTGGNKFHNDGPRQHNRKTSLTSPLV